MRMWLLRFLVYCDSNVNSTAILKSNLLIFGKIEQSQLHSAGELFMSIYKLAQFCNFNSNRVLMAIQVSIIKRVNEYKHGRWKYLCAWILKLDCSSSNARSNTYSGSKNLSYLCLILIYKMGVKMSQGCWEKYMI